MATSINIHAVHVIVNTAEIPQGDSLPTSDSALPIRFHIVPQEGRWRMVLTAQGGGKLQGTVLLWYDVPGGQEPKTEPPW